MEDETSQLAQEHYHFLKFVLLVYTRRLSHVVELIGDNASTNRAFARLIGLNYIGFYLHRLNLALKEFLSDHQIVIDRIKRLMQKLSSCISLAHLH